MELSTFLKNRTGTFLSERFFIEPINISKEPPFPERVLYGTLHISKEPCWNLSFRTVLYGTINTSKEPFSLKRFCIELSTFPKNPGGTLFSKSVRAGPALNSTTFWTASSAKSSITTRIQSSTSATLRWMTPHWGII